MSVLRRNTWRGVGSLAAAAAMALSAGGAAMAHDCFNASRSAQGNDSVAAHSAAWQYVTLDTVLTQFIGLPQDLATCVESNAAAYGIPDSFVFGGKQDPKSGEIASRNPNDALFTNGKGIDHAEDAYGPALDAAIGACAGG